MFVLYDAMQKTRILIARRDISRTGIIFLQGLQLRAVLEQGLYSREGLIWGNTVIKVQQQMQSPQSILSYIGNF